MNRGINIILYQTLRDQDSILVVITFPFHESDQRVLTKCKFTHGSRRTICNNFALFNMIALVDDRTLIVAVRLVRSLELGQDIFICLTII